jgi:hypothetical protein
MPQKRHGGAIAVKQTRKSESVSLQQGQITKLARSLRKQRYASGMAMLGEMQANLLPKLAVANVQ